MENIGKYKDELSEYLVKSCTGSGYLKGVLLSSPDIDASWVRYAPPFFADAVRNFNAYPEYCLACAGYLGMAVASLWDKDWERYADTQYSFFLGDRGFDDMDDHITGTILQDGTRSVCAMEAVSANAYHFLMKESPEPGTADAYKLFLATEEIVYRVGAAIELCRLGYRLEKVAPDGGAE